MLKPFGKNGTLVRLFAALNTVKFHVSSIISKVGSNVEKGNYSFSERQRARISYGL